MAGRRRVNVRRQTVEESVPVPGSDTGNGAVDTGNHTGNGVVDTGNHTGNGAVDTGNHTGNGVVDTGNHTCNGDDVEISPYKGVVSTVTETFVNTVTGTVVTDPNNNSNRYGVPPETSSDDLRGAGQSATPLSAPAPLHDLSSIVDQMREQAKVLGEQSRALGESKAALAEAIRDRDEAQEALAAKKAARKTANEKSYWGTPAQTAAMVEIFEDYRRILGYSDRTLTPERREFLLPRIQEGFTREQFQAVFTFAAQDEYLRGANNRNKKFDDIKNLCKDRASFELFLDKPSVVNWRKQGTNDPTLMPKPQSEIQGTMI
jgi:hypothetical protein